MIKLIVSDLDGTLLNDDKELPEGFGELLAKLDANGIIFSTASGRNYLTQAHVFAPHIQKMSFICDNGAYISENNNISRVSIIQPSTWKALTAYIQSELDYAICVLCGLNGAYSIDFSDYRDIPQIMDTVYSGVKFVDRLFDVDDDIFKISVCCPNAAQNKLKPLLCKACPPDVSALVTHPSFMDVMNVGISKGSAIEFLQNKYGISYDETMVFGDYYNDVDMLSTGRYSYIMENAPDDMKAFANYVAPSNNARGVAAVIEDYINTVL